MALTASDYAQLIHGLMPRGPAWNDQVIANFAQAWAVELARIDARIAQLLEEADPRTADEMLGDWERVLGLPDKCTVALDLSTLDRQRVAWAKLTEQGGQSRAYFIDLAARYGEPGVTIDEVRPMHCNDTCNDVLWSDDDLFTWRVNIPRPALNLRAMDCNDDCNDALQSYSPSLAECPLTERKPAHTTVIFTYLSS